VAALDGGYTVGAPSPEAAAIDATCVAEAPCPRCRTRGRDYLPTMRGSSYRGWAICARCGHVEEV
jgi:hypothetical protein